MDYGNLSIEEIRQGYRLLEDQEAYVCNYCGKAYPLGEVFPIGGSFCLPERAIVQHIESDHGGTFDQLIEGGAKYNTFTDTQKQLLALFHEGLADKEIAEKLGIAASTVRHQKFTFREKAKQAKYYLAVYEDAFKSPSNTETSDEIMSIPNTATMLDDRYVITEKEKAQILKSEFSNLDPLRLKKYPKKAKKEVVVLSRIAEEFELGRTYSEKEMRAILTPINEDFNKMARYLVDYGFMSRTKDGSEYWLK